jgi:hypothetical protein
LHVVERGVRCKIYKGFEKEWQTARASVPVFISALLFMCNTFLISVQQFVQTLMMCGSVTVQSYLISMHMHKSL